MSNRSQGFNEQHLISQKSALGLKFLIIIVFSQSENHGFEAKKYLDLFFNTNIIALYTK